MTDEELLLEVKSRKGITGEYQDEKVLGYIQDVKEYMIDAGVPESVMTSRRIIGAVTRGVSDLYDEGNDNGKFSTYFRERVIQLSIGGANNV